MTKLVLSKDEVKQIVYEGHPTYEVVEEGDWTQDHKYQYCTIIFKDTTTDKHYEMGISRSGSYHTDWYYSWEDSGEEAVEVKKVTKTITVESWEAV